MTIIDGSQLEPELEKGSLILKNDDKMTCSTDSEIKLHYAFSRRAVAQGDDFSAA